MEFMCNGKFLQKSLDETFKFLDELAEEAHTWSGPNLTKSTSKTQPSGIYQLREEYSLKAQLALIPRKLDVLEAKWSFKTGC